MTVNDRCLTPFRRPIRPFPALGGGLDERFQRRLLFGCGTLRLMAASVKVMVAGGANGTFPRPSHDRSARLRIG